MRTLARLCATASAVLALLVTLIGAALAPGHSHSANYISELGARGAAHGELVSYAGFLTIGITALIALIASARLEVNRPLRSSIVWLLTLPLAYIVAAFARCTEGCAGMDGAQALHNLAGMAEYVGGTVALAVAGSALVRTGSGRTGAVLWLLAAAVFLCLYGIGNPFFDYRGAAQRVAETILFGFLNFLAWRRTSK